MPSLRCLISALTQAGGGDVLLRFASSIQSCCGEGGALQADVAVCGEHSPCSGQAACSFGGLSPGAPSPLARRAFSLRGPSARCRSGLRKSLDRNRGLFAGWEGVASLGLSLPLSPPPASYLQRGWGGSSLEFLSPFVLRTASSKFGLVNFSLLSHSLKKLPLTALRAFRLVLTLSNATRSSPFRPHLLVVGAGVWGTFLLGVAFRHVICGPYLISPPS